MVKVWPRPVRLARYRLISTVSPGLCCARISLQSARLGDGPAINGGDDITDLGALTAYIAVLIDGHDAQTRRDAVIIGFIAAYFHHGDAQLCPTGHPAVLH